MHDNKQSKFTLRSIHDTLDEPGQIEADDVGADTMPQPADSDAEEGPTHEETQEQAAENGMLSSS